MRGDVAKRHLVEALRRQSRLISAYATILEAGDSSAGDITRNVGIVSMELTDLTERLAEMGEERSS